MSVGFNVLTAVTIKSTVFWGVMKATDISEERATSIFKVEE
jgi:hypothetical protein